MKVIREHIASIRKLCKVYHVEALYVFGSVLTEHFSPDSDIDFLVSFSGVDPQEYFDNYMDLKEALEDVLSRKVDLLEMQTLKNPILKRAVHKEKRILYGRENSEMAI
jgi:predicted nucleotidyltransferase